MPNCEPSTKRVEALTSTAAASTSRVKRRAFRRSEVTMASARPGAVTADVLDGLIEAVNHPDGEDVVEILGVPVLLGGRPRRRHEGPRPLVAAELHSRLAETCGGPREESRRHRGIHEERLDG